MSTPMPALDPRRTALLVMDFQQGVLQRIPGPEPLLGRVRRAIADVRDHGGTIGYEQTRDVLLGKVFPRRAQVIDTAALRTLLQET